MLFKGFFAKLFFTFSIFVLFLGNFSFASSEKEGGKDEAFNVKETTFHHLLDQYWLKGFRHAKRLLPATE